jgi:hypothetical protein
MAVTLAQASLNAASAIDRNIIDEFRKSSFLLDQMPFDQSVNPAGGGSTLVYGYTRQTTQRAAAFRTINAEYTPTQVEKAQYTVNLRPLGGAFEIDRVLTGIGAISEVGFQLAQLVKATKAYFADQVINGNDAVTTNGFDGLNQALIGSSTEVAGPILDLTAVNSTATALTAVQRINAWLARMDGTPHALLMNGVAKSMISMVAGFTGQLRSTVDAFGVEQEYFRGIPLIDLGEKAGVSDRVIGNFGVGTNEVQTITASGTWTSGTFRLGFQGEWTAPISYAATAAACVTALNLLSNIDSGDVTATGANPLGSTPLVITFADGGRYDGVDVPLMQIDVTSIVGADHAAVVTTVDGVPSTDPGGITDLYAVRFGLDGFHGVAVPGQLIQTWMPDFSTAGAVKKGEVEMGPVAVVLKSSKAAAVLRNVKVA